MNALWEGKAKVKRALFPGAAVQPDDGASQDGHGLCGALARRERSRRPFLRVCVGKMARPAT